MNKRMTQIVTRRKIKQKSKKKKREKENKSENTENGSKTENGKRKKMLDQKILMTFSPNIREESWKQMMLGRSQKILKMTKRQRSLRTQKEKETQQKYRNLSKVMWERIPKEIHTQ